MSAPTVEELKKAIGELSEKEKRSLASWMNLSVIREELIASDRQIANGQGIEYNESTLPDLFAETRASAMQLLNTKTAKHS